MRWLLWIVALAGCDKKAPDPKDDFARRFEATACACKDVACTKPIAAEAQRHGVPTDIAAVERFAAARACIAKLEAAQDPYETQPAVPASVTADALVRSVRAWIAAKYPGTFIQSLRADYVEANGAIEPDHGELQFGFGAPQTVVDDPKRKTGVPAPRDAQVVTVCPGARWLIQDRWHTWQEKCSDMPAYTLRCSIEAIWQRAIAEGAPADAVAKISFEQARNPPWRFEIVDEPRKIRITHRFADDCELAVEKP